MTTEMKLSERTIRMLRCPACRATLASSGDVMRCTNSACGRQFQVVNGVPVLINESSSLFSAEGPPTPHIDANKSVRNIKRAIAQKLPALGRNCKARPNYRDLTRLLTQRMPDPRVLVVGGRTAGQGMEIVFSCPSIELIESDVMFGPRVGMICDAHDLPFEDNSLDGVIIQAVLGNLADPYRCVQEIHRVLRADGLVYAETAFLQAVQDGGYDFTRFTQTGIRRLFRQFDEIGSGAVCGPGMALAKLYEKFLQSFVDKPAARAIMSAIARCTGFWLKWFDPYLVNRPGGVDAASGVFFMGRKSDRIASDVELINRYRGFRNQLS